MLGVPMAATVLRRQWTHGAGAEENRCSTRIHMDTGRAAGAACSGDGAAALLRNHWVIDMDIRGAPKLFPGIWFSGR